MSDVLNVATRALMANQTVLQTTGNNIANVNTAGYSRQNAVLTTVEGQYTGSGYIGKGVDVATIERTYSAFLNRQSNLANATASSDEARATKMAQLENLFTGGESGLGAAVNDMLNAFSDVATAPTDLTARTAALTRVNETALRMSGISSQLDDLQLGLRQEIGEKITAINTLAQNLAQLNESIAKAQGNGHSPNDMLDQRDQVLRDLNRYIQTTTVTASDGSYSVFVGGSHALVLGNTVGTLSLTSDDFGDPNKSKLGFSRNGQSFTLDEASLGGGEVPGLLRFQNQDLLEARNLLGRYTTVVATSLNQQHQLGLDLDGNPGGNLLTPVTFTAGNILAPQPPAVVNTGNANLTLAIADMGQLVASDYQVYFSGANSGQVVRLSDNRVTNFGSVPVTVDGLTLDVGSGTANAGDRFLLKPYATAASAIRSEFSSPRALAVASPVAGQMGSANTGSLQLASLQARSATISATPVVFTFTGPNSYTRSDTGATVYTYVSGQTISGGSPTEWELTLQGTPNAGDTFTVQQQPAATRNQNTGNAAAIMNLRDRTVFDGAPMTDGWAGLIAQVGVRAQSANYSAEVSTALAANLEKERTAVSGVNLDEEASKLLQFQQAYQASAKVIQVAQSIFDTLIQSIGR